MNFVPDRESLAWAAGFFDGEGSTFVGRRNGRPDRTGLAITQCDTAVLLRFQTAVGGLGAITGPRKRRSPNHRPQWSYRTDNWRHVQAIVAMLWPWLGDVKRDQYRRALERVRAQSVWGRSRREVGDRNRAKTHCPQGHAYDETNTYVDFQGWRECRICRRVFIRRWKDARCAKVG